MSLFRLRLPSPALVVSCIALVVAMGGTSYAAFTLSKNSVGTRQLKNGAVTKSKIKNGAVTAAKINTTGLTVPNALTAANASTATNATTASHASTADSATTAGSAPPVAYADIASNGVIQANTTPSNLSAANIDHPSPGVYCLKDLSFTPKTAVVSADNSFDEDLTIASVVVVAPNSVALNGCSSGEDVRVRTVAVPNGANYAPPALADESFTIWLN